jgi:dihydroorotase
MNSITIRRPDDWHVHLRDGDILEGVAIHTARQFARAIVMPNLVPPVTDIALASAYRDRILAALPDGTDFTPLMTAYLTDDTCPDEMRRGFAEGVFTAAKLYPANATTNSSHGVSDVSNLDPVLAVMQDIGMPLLVHGEVTESHIDIFDREKEFTPAPRSARPATAGRAGRPDRPARLPGTPRAALRSGVRRAATRRRRR